MTDVMCPWCGGRGKIDARVKATVDWLNTPEPVELTDLQLLTAATGNFFAGLNLGNPQPPGWRHGDPLTTPICDLPEAAV